MRDIVRIETERLTLRRLTIADAARISRLTSDQDVARMLAQVPCPNPVVAVEGWILIGLARASLALDHVFGVELPGEGLIGCVGAHKGKEGAVELGYWFGKPYWGEGFGTEAVRAFVAEASTLGPLHAGHFVDNLRSGRVLEKAGFAYTGEMTPLFSLARGHAVPTRRMAHRASASRKQREAELCA